MNEQPTDQEIQQTADVINRLQKGFLPQPIFHAVASKVTTPTMEVAALRAGESGKIEILLTKRPDDDPHWPGGWHITGTVIRAADSEGSLESGFARVLKDELYGTIQPIGGFHYVGMKFWDVTRGRELDLVHYFVTDAKDEDVTEGQFFDVENLPETTLEHHKIMIPEIVEAYRKSN